MDVLSANSTYSRFILSLQRSGLVDQVNELENVTLLAPTNDAFKSLGLPYLLMNASTLFKFVVDQPVLSGDVNGVNIYSTLNRHGSPFFNDLSVPILFDRESDGFSIENARVIYPDNLAPASNSVVHGIDSLLVDIKPSVCESFQTIHIHNSFASLFNQDNYCSNFKISNVTFLYPANSLFNRWFTEIELAYLHHQLGSQDREMVLGNFILLGMYGGNMFGRTISTENLLGESVHLSSRYQGNEILVDGNSSQSTSANILLSDGMAHYFEEMELSKLRFPTFTPRKYLIGLNQTDFVDELDFRRLSALIDDLDLEQTIFITLQDSSLSVKSQSKNSLLYKFAKGKIELNGDRMIESKFCTQSSLGHCQKLKMARLSGDDYLLNGHSHILSDRYQIGNTYIYLVDDDIPLPGKLEHSISPVDRCAKTLRFMDDFGQLKFKHNDGRGYTVFLPTSDAWSDIDLTLDYLIAHEDKLELVLGNLVLNGLVYSDFVGSKQLTNINDDPIVLDKMRDSTTVTINNRIQLPLSFGSEALFRDGVAYPVNRVVLPESMTITMDELIETAQAEEFLNILKAVNLTNLPYDPYYSFIVPSSATLLIANITSLTKGLSFLEEFARLHILPGKSLDKALSCEKEIPTLLDGVHLTCNKLPSGGRMLQILEGNDHEVRVLRSGFTTTDSGLLLIDKPLNPDWLDSHNRPLIRLRLPFVSVLIGIVLGMVILTSILSFCFFFTVGSDSAKQSDLEIADDNPNEQTPNRQDERSRLFAPTAPTVPTAPMAHTGYGSIDSKRPTESRRAVEPLGFSERYSTHSKAKAINCSRVRTEI
ncbi:hypothetical protein FOA43_002927 [Brettanomyces nanus]|uniref:FAS1 domain-containing protein n=1 Tax=Eeniella nana TaxID=13502 RepID=A0A875S1F7_EENNA|nr:uncharacterized protein FOA43_002927 [Brettanomyces nanus]QPG75571.1 hypothetical protein FOA43_002927 [Brettanomyces nanus]